MTSLQQSLGALDRANQVRRAVAATRRDVAAGRLSFSEALNSESGSRMFVVALLEAVPQVGRATARRVMVATGIGPRARVGDLAAPRRERLEDVLYDQRPRRSKLTGIQQHALREIADGHVTRDTRWRSSRFAPRTLNSLVKRGLVEVSEAGVARLTDQGEYVL